VDTDLVIIGAGASGLMAGVHAAKRGLRVVMLERKHLPGRKLLMCGNARCNITSDLSAQKMLECYGMPVADFLRKAIQSFPPAALRAWMKQHGLATTVHKDRRVFPASEKASDVLRFFTDLLRKERVPIMYNCPVERIEPAKEGWVVQARHCRLLTKQVLVATGGVSYPKTGSVGDGQKMAGSLGHKVLPFRPGLVGYEVEEDWLRAYTGEGFQHTTLTIKGTKNQPLAVTHGEVRCERWGITGPAVVNASRIVARRNLKDYTFCVDLFPDWSPEDLIQRLSKTSLDGRHNVERCIAGLGIPAILCREFTERNLPFRSGEKKKAIAERLKNWALHPVRARSLKEAMVTVGGISLDDIMPEQMESKRHSGLFFAGEVMDVDGPTGGFNLHAAFATARLAVECMAPAAEATPERRRRRNRRYHE